MKTLKLLNKKNFAIIIFSLIASAISFAEDKPVDIWNIEKKKLIQFQRKIYLTKMVMKKYLKIMFIECNLIKKMTL